MPEKLMHLPTKPTMVHPKGERAFVRRQHYQPNEKQVERKERAGKEEQQENHGNRVIAPLKPLVRLQAGHPPESNTPAQISRVEPRSDQLRHAEDIMNGKLPEEIFNKHQFEPVGTNTMNGVYTFVGDDNQRFYWKPREEEGVGMKKMLEKNEIARHLNPDGIIRETIRSNFAGREITTYEASKMLGAEGLVPPTKNWEQQIGPGESGYWSGSAQMSVHDFGTKILGHEKVMSVPEMIDNQKMKWILNKADNASDMVVFDFITGNTDRHGGNFYVAKKQDGNYHLIANDNGLTLPEHDADMIHPDQQNSLETWRDYFKTDSKNKPIGDDFLTGVLSFDEATFREMAMRNGISKKAQDGMVHRVNLIQKRVKNKYMAATEKYANRDWESIEERRSVLKKETQFTGEDLQHIIKKEMLTTHRSDGTEKYTAETMGKQIGNVFWNAKDWMKQVDWVFEGDWDED